MPEPNIIQKLGHALNENSIPCLLVGGFAVGFYHYQRQTFDIDFLILHDDLKRVQSLLEAQNYRVVAQGKAFARFRSKDTTQIGVDLLFVDVDTFNLMLKQGKTVQMYGEKFVVPSLDHLLAMKLHAIKQAPNFRELKDLLDIMLLIKENKIDIQSDSFRDLCLKYGTEDIYKKILQKI